VQRTARCSRPVESHRLAAYLLRIKVDQRVQSRIQLLDAFKVLLGELKCGNLLCCKQCKQLDGGLRKKVAQVKSLRLSFRFRRVRNIVEFE